MKTAILLILFFNFSTYSYTLGPEAIYHRCFAQLTQNTPYATDYGKAQLNAIKAGQLDPIDACMKLLDRAKFNKNGGKQINSFSDTIATNVLTTMNNVHYSWLETQTIPEISNAFHRHMMNFFDPSAAALYMTRSLFDPNFSYDKIIKGNITFNSERLIPRSTSIYPYSGNSSFPSNPSGENDEDKWIFHHTEFPNVGNMIGVTEMPVNWSIPYSYNNERTGTPSWVSGQVIVNPHWGGGMLGHQMYMIQASKIMNFNQQTDGGVHTNRRWARAVFKDVLCRDLPVVRASDGTNFVSNSSPLAFRNATGCVKCHVSMDRLAGVTRNIKTSKVGKFFNKGNVSIMAKHAVTQAAAEVFPLESDEDYYQRPTEGHLYFRTYDGRLINKKVNNVNQLGNQLSQLDDMYICQAKRYYEYFTGVSADIGDIGDIDHPVLSPEQTAVRDTVIQLGLNFKTHKNPRKLIHEILSRPEYSETDFHVRSPANE